MNYLFDFGLTRNMHNTFNRLLGSAQKTGRVISLSRRRYEIVTDNGFFSARLSGVFFKNTASKAELPTVGDWVALHSEKSGLRIDRLLPRTNTLSRKMPGTASEEQVLAANISTAFIVTAADGDFSVSRLERYLAVVRKSGAEPVILLSKVDASSSVDTLMARIEEIAFGTPFYAVSSLFESTKKLLIHLIPPGTTAVFIGSSGVGKSTLINLLMENDQRKTSTVSTASGKGRHTTSSRNLLLLPDGGMVIDTPGLRELQPWLMPGEELFAFPDIEQLAQRCKFANCSHRSEPGCAVTAALSDGRLHEKRYQRFLALREEVLLLHRERKTKSRMLRSGVRK